MKKSRNYIKNVINDALLKGKLQGSNKISNILMNKIDKKKVLSRKESEDMIKRLRG